MSTIGETPIISGETRNPSNIGETRATQKGRPRPPWIFAAQMRKRKEGTHAFLRPTNKDHDYCAHTQTKKDKDPCPPTDLQHHNN